MERSDSHAQSQFHVGVCVVYEQWKRNKIIDVNMRKDARNVTNGDRYLSTSSALQSFWSLATYPLEYMVLAQSTYGNVLSIIQLLVHLIQF